MKKKPAWVVDKERRKAPETVWLFGIHAVREALENPRRVAHRLILTKNALDRLGEAVTSSGLQPEMADPRKFSAPLDAQSVHQGSALEVSPLDWGEVGEVCRPQSASDIVLLLDRVTDPHNVGAILRSAEVFGARAVVAPLRHSCPETGALAKSASGALERQPYVRVRNLGKAMQILQDSGYRIIGLDGEAEETLEAALSDHSPTPIAIALGAEGPGLRHGTREACDTLAAIPSSGGFASLNVSNAAAVALYAAQRHMSTHLDITN
jgi:23S rRNA (guanosine2251-2'-O)-methyltransferase